MTVYRVKISADQEDKVERSVDEDETLRADRWYENVCGRVIGKCMFLLLAVQPAILGKNVLWSLLIVPQFLLALSTKVSVVEPAL